MNTRSSAISLDRRAGLERHVGERALGRLAIGRAVELLGRGHALGDRARPSPGSSPTSPAARSRAASIDDLAVELGALIGGQLAPARDRLLQLRALRRAGALRSLNHANVVSSGAIIPARPPPSIVMLQTVIRPSIDSASIAGPAYSTDVAGHRRRRRVCPIVPRIRSFAVTPKPSSPVVADPHRARPVLDHALRRQHVLDLARADPERERPERAVRRGVRVAADDRHARLGHAQLGADHVHDPLPLGAQRVERARRTRRSCAPVFPPARARARP